MESFQAAQSASRVIVDDPFRGMAFLENYVSIINNAE